MYTHFSHISSLSCHRTEMNGNSTGSRWNRWSQLHKFLTLRAVKSNFSELHSRVVCTADDYMRSQRRPLVLFHNTKQVIYWKHSYRLAFPQVPSYNLGRFIDSLKMFCGVPRHRLTNAETMPWKKITTCSRLNIQNNLIRCFMTYEVETVVK
jgi:hypothetical protein